MTTEIIVQPSEKKKYDYAKYYSTYYYKHHADLIEYKKKTNKTYYGKYKKR